MDWTSAYLDRQEVLTDVACEIEKTLKDLLQDVPRIDRITIRVKSVDSFIEKANRINPKSGENKYNYPLEEVQDQIGARAVVFYRSDVSPVKERVLAEFRLVENRKVEEPRPESFGYEAQHFVCLIPHDIYIKHSPPIDFFELQVSTLFQHAWAEANHDLGYKPEGGLTYDDQKRLAWAAAQTWGADIIFDMLWRGHDSTS